MSANKGMLTAAERKLLSQLAATDNLDGQRAKGLLGLDEGLTLTAAAEAAGLTKGQLTYALRKLRDHGIASLTGIEPPTAAPKQAEKETAKETAPQTAQAKFEKIMADLNQAAARLQKRVPNFVPPPFTPQGFLKIIRENADRFTPNVVKDLGENLRDAKPEDFKDPDTWKGLWFILSYSLQEESKSLLDKVSDRAATIPGVAKGVELGKEAYSQMPSLGESIAKGKEMIDAVPGAKRGKEILASMPGAGLVSELSSMMEGATPQDFLDKDTWAGMWYVINHTIQSEAAELRKRLVGESAEDEEIIVSSDE